MLNKKTCVKWNKFEELGKKNQPPTIFGRFGAALITRLLFPFTDTHTLSLSLAPSPSVFSSNKDTLLLSLICYAIVLTCLILSNDKIDKMLRWKFETTEEEMKEKNTNDDEQPKPSILMSENKKKLQFHMEMNFFEENKRLLIFHRWQTAKHRRKNTRNKD